MPSRDVDLSQQSFCGLLRLCCFRQRVSQILGGVILLGIAIVMLVLFRQEDGPVAGTWKEIAPVSITILSMLSVMLFIMAYFRSPLAWALGEPEDSEILLVCIKRCFCCSKRIYPTPSIDTMPSRSDSEILRANSTNIQRSVSSLLLELHQAAIKRSRRAERNTEIDDSDTWTCIRCILCRKSSDQEASANTCENQIQSSTDPTDNGSSKENMEMIELDPELQRPSSSQQAPEDVVNLEGSKEFTCPEKSSACQYLNTQEPTAELKQSSTDPTDKKSSEENMERPSSPQTPEDVKNSEGFEKLTFLENRLSCPYF